MNHDQRRVRIDLPMDQIAAFCERWHISELALFGSVLRDDFGPDSDIDVLVKFVSETDLLADREKMRDELQMLFGRPVDVVYRWVIEHDMNYLIRRSILNSARVVHAA